MSDPVAPLLAEVKAGRLDGQAVNAVLEAAGRLHRRAAPQVHDALGQGGRTSRATGALGDQDAGAGFGGTEGGRGPRGAETDDDDVSRVVPMCDL